MKRLIKKSIPVSRLRRKILSDWQPIDVNGPDTVQVITDAMASAAQIQIEYQGSGWRLIQPYGWNTSKDGNVLLMCYKDTGEIRSYRLDRILQVLVDNSLLNYQDTTQNNDMLEVRDYNNPEDFEIPALPNMDEILQQSEEEQGQELPYDEGLDYLTNNNFVPENVNEDVSNEVEEQPEQAEQPEESKEVEQPKETEKPEEENKDDLVDDLLVDNKEDNNEK